MLIVIEFIYNIRGVRKGGAKGAVAPLLFSAGNYYGTAFHFKSLIHCQSKSRTFFSKIVVMSHSVTHD